VDTFVGCSGSLLDPATIAVGGIEVNVAAKTVLVLNTVVAFTFDSYDFAGYHIDNDGDNVTFINCNFSNGANSSIFSRSDSSDLHLDHCTFDGLGSADAIVTMSGTNAVVEFCWFKNCAGDSFQLQSPGGGTLTMDHNLIEQAGQGVGSHGDFLQVFTGVPVVANITFNTTRQASGFTQGFMLEPDGGPWGAGIITSGDINSNTFVNLGDGTQFVFTGVTVDDITDTVTVRNNYFAGASLAPGGARGGPNDATGKTIFSGNVDMVSGLPASNDDVLAGPPLSFTDPRFVGMTELTSQFLLNDGLTATKQSVTMRGTGEPQGRAAFQMGNGTTLTLSRCFAREGIRTGGTGIVVDTCWIECDGFVDEDDHADCCQLFPAAVGLIDCRNTTFRAHPGGDLGPNSHGSVGYFWADNFQGTARFNNCVFWGGEFGCRIHADTGTTHLDFKDVFFVGPFTNDATLISETGGTLVVDRWDNVRNATIVGGVLVPGTLIPAPI